MNIYKYMHQDRIENILVDNKIRFTQPKYFNDPFELKISIKGIDTEENIRKIFENTFNEEVLKMYNDLLIDNKIDYETFYNCINSKLDKDLYINLFNTEKTKSLLKKNLDEKTNDILGILSLTTKYDNLLMWAHYANEHKGFVVEFDSNNDFFKPIEIDNYIYNGLQKVNYSPIRPYKLLVENEWEDILLTKSEEWIYEDEFRIIKRLQDADEVKEGIYHLFLFPKKMIKAIYCGCNMSIDDEIKISKILDNDKELSHIKIYKAKVSDKYYKLDFEQIK